MKKYVSPELNVELFSLVDMIMESGTEYINDTPDEIPIEITPDP